MCVYIDRREIETEKEEFDMQLKKEELGEETENMDLYDRRLPDAVFREEIFNPGMSGLCVSVSLCLCGCVTWSFGRRCQRHVRCRM